MQTHRLFELFSTCFQSLTKFKLLFTQTWTVAVIYLWLFNWFNRIHYFQLLWLFCKSLIKSHFNCYCWWFQSERIFYHPEPAVKRFLYLLLHFKAWIFSCEEYFYHIDHYLSFNYFLFAFPNHYSFDFIDSLS